MKQKKGGIVKEEWRDVVGYEGYYQVSNFGKVRSIDRDIINTRGIVSRYKGKELSPHLHPNGYLVVVLSLKSKRITKKVHRLVAISFIDGDTTLQVNHINGIKTDNRSENLEWVTFSENQTHAYKLGLSVSSKGEDHGHHKLTEENVLEIRRLHSTTKLGYTRLSRMFNVDRSTIRAIVTRKSWRHI